MKKISERDAVFLAEMGIGPLWQLRSAPEAVDAPEMEEMAAGAGKAATPAEAPAAPAPLQSPEPASAPAPAQTPGS